MSDWKQRALERRDFRHDPTEVRPLSASRKERRHWCQGKRGVPHKTVCRPYDEAKGISLGGYEKWRVLYCTVCGKELKYWMPLLGARNPETPPDWVDC